MADYIIMPKADYQNACEAVRGKTGKSEAIKSGDLANEIYSIDTSGADGNTTMSEYVSGESYALTLPVGVTAIKNYAFYKDSSVTSVSLPATLTSIGTEAFRECGMVNEVTIPENVETVGYRAFGYNGNLETVTFLGTPTEIRSDAFLNAGIYDLYVPWKEGAVSGAPWGAVMAAIYYETEV